MRTLDPILQAAMDSGNFTPIVRAAVLDPDDHTVVEYLDLVYYKISGIDIEIEFYDPAGGFSDSVSLERGAKIGDTEYTIFSGIYKLTHSYLIKGGRYGLYKCSGSLIEPSAVEVTGDVSYHTVIDSVLALGTNSAAFKTPAAAWLGYQFLPDGQSFLSSNIFSFFALLRQKYLIHATENGLVSSPSGNSILFFSVADTLALASQYTINLSEKDTWSIKADYRQFIWKDETGTFHNPGPAFYPVHNLGYLESTAAAPSIPDNVQQIAETLVTCIPNLKYQAGDCVKFDPGLDGYSPVKSVLDVTEVFNAREKKVKEPAWYMELRPLAYFCNTPGGSIPVTSQYTAAYSQLATNGFNGVLNHSVTSVQALADAIDQYSPVQIRVTTPTIQIAGKDFAWSTADGKLYVWTGAAWACAGPYITSISGTAPIVVSAGSTPAISITGVDATHAGSVPLSGTPAGRRFLRAAQTTGAVAWDVLQAGDIPDLSGYYQPLDDDLTYLADIDVTRGAIIRKGLGNWEGLAKGSAYAVLTGDGTDTLWSTFLLSGTAGGKMNFAVSNTKTLTLTATNSYNLTIPATGTAALLNQANSFTLINPITTIAESWIGPSTTNGIYFKGGNVGIGSIMASGGVSYYKFNLNGTQLFLGTDSVTESPIFKIAPSYISNVHSDYTTTVSFIVYDASSDYECMRFDAVSEPKIGFFGHSASAQPSAYTPTNVTTDRAYNANATSVDELADVLGTLIADLQSLGLVG